MTSPELPGALQALVIETEHYLIRRATEQDLRLWQQSWLGEPELMRFSGLSALHSWDACLTLLNACDQRQHFLFSIVCKVSGASIGLHRLVCDHYNSLAYPTVIIAEQSHTGAGRAHEVRAAVNDFIFERLGLNKVVISIYGDNLRALKAIAKTDRVKEGVLRRHEWVDGAGWQDVHVFRLLRSEWEAQRLKRAP